MSGFGDDNDWKEIDLGLPDDLDALLQEKHRAGFLAELEERLSGLDDLLEALLKTDHQVDLINQIKGQIHTIKGEGGSFGFPAATTLAHACEDYMKAAPRPYTEKQIADLYQYMDAIRSSTILAGAQGIQAFDLEAALEKLPHIPGS